MKNNRFDLNIPVTLVNIAASFTFVCISYISATMTVDRVAGNRAKDINLADSTSEITRQSELNTAKAEQEADAIQDKIDNNTNIYDSITLSDYVCDPENPPEFYFANLTNPKKTLNVADRNSRVIGTLDFTGEFHFNPQNCTR